MTTQRTIDTREVHLIAGTLAELAAEVDVAIGNIANPWRFTGAEVDCDHTEHWGGSSLIRSSTTWTATITSERHF